MAGSVVLLPEFCGHSDQEQVFWNESLTLNTSTPDFTVCFQRTVLLWIPCGWLWDVTFLFCLFRLFYCKKKRHGSCDYSFLNIVKLIVSSLITLNTLMGVILLLTNTKHPSPVDLMYYITRFLTMALVTVFVRLEYVKGLHTSGTTFGFWLLQLICDIVILRSWVLRGGVEVDKAQFILYCMYFSLVCIMFVLYLFPDHGALRWTKNNTKIYKLTQYTPLLQEQDDEEDYDEEYVDVDDKKTVPEMYAPFWKQVTFQWATGDVYRGYKKVMTFKSLYNLRPYETCRKLVPLFYSFFNRNQSKEPISLRDKYGEKRKRRSFLLSAFLSGGYAIIPGIFLDMLGLGMKMLQPLVLGMLIDFIESNDPYTWKGILLASGLFFTGFMGIILCNNYQYLAFMSGMRVKTMACAVIYRKALRLSGSAKKLTSVGEILNLMSVDAQKLQDVWIFSNVCWELPLLMIVSFSLISKFVGTSSLAGVALLFILLPVNGFYNANWIRKLQAKQMQQKDIRIKDISETLSGIKIIKLYAWEIPFLEKVMGTRAKEVHYLKITNLVVAATTTIWALTPYLVSLVVFATFVLSSPTNILDARTAFVTMSLINTMNITLAILPLGAKSFGEAIVSVKRINKFLEMEELDEDVVETDYGMSNAIAIDNGSFSWEKDGRIVLKEIQLRVPHGKLVAVVGHVGSGKTSLISALLGEMAKVQGNIRLNGSLAFVPQQAWIQNESLRDNILFGKAYHRGHYDRILDATALLPDLEILTDGDLTEIGEKGINLSGGQKQRVSLARAVYQNEDIYLLDDPLSAVDAHVGKHIFEKVISNNGLLRNKTRILVTHGISFLRHVDVIVVMNDGIISEMGPFSKLIAQNGAFANFLESYFNERTDYSSDEEEDILAIHSQLSALSASESDKEGNHFKPQKLRKRKSIGSRSRGNSISGTLQIQKTASMKSEGDGPIKLIEDEVAEVGNVRGQIIWSYINAGGRNMFYLVIFFHLLTVGSQVLTSLWLSAWSTDQVGPNGTMDFGLVSYRLGIYATVGISQGIPIAVILVTCALGGVSASAHLHENLLIRLLRAPMSFFDITPLGRIMNRCTKDMDLVDSNLPAYVRSLIFSLSPTLTSFVVISYTTPEFLLALVPLIIFYGFVQRTYTKFNRQLKRIHNIQQSPIYAHFDETLNGATSIKAYGRQEDFTYKCDKLIDRSQMPFYMTSVGQRWLSVSLETTGTLITFLAALLAVLSRGSINGGLAGLSVSYALSVTVMIGALVRATSELEAVMVSVERIDEYCHISQEAEWIIQETETDNKWPDEGNIKIENYGTRYRPGLDLVLKDLTCDITAGEKIGIVGRTGAGKSSLALALFRIVESARGSITIDGVPIANLGLHNLRSRLTIIPQDPVMFSGTLRQNFDPLSEYSEKELWQAVEKSHLKGFVESLPEGLDYECGEGGESLSVGQRQLVCLARAILRKSRVLVLDEATAAVDLETDSLIQTTIRDMFRDSTILTIAHRLATVIDYDRIMVLDQGSIKEFDSPAALLEQLDSVFYGLAKEAGVI